MLNVQWLLYGSGQFDYFLHSLFSHFVSFFSFPLLYHQRNCLVCKEVYFRYRNNPKHVSVHEKLATREFTKKQISEKVTRKQKQRSFGETSFLQEPQRQCFVLMVVGRRQWCHHSLEYLGDNGEHPGPNHNKYWVLIYFKPDIYMLCLQDLILILTHYMK